MRAKLLVSFVIIVTAFIAGLWFANSTKNDVSVPDIPGFLWPNPPEIQPFSLSTTDGSTFTEADFLEHWTVLFFGFTNCPDICPTTMATLNEVYEQLHQTSKLKDKLQVVFVSVDPERDNQSVLESYVHYFNEAFIGVSADDQVLRAFTRQFGILFMRVEAAGVADYSMDHSASVLLVDPALRFVGVFSQPHTVADIVARLSQMVAYLADSGE